jgi:hypothetical protein
VRKQLSGRTLKRALTASACVGAGFGAVHGIPEPSTARADYTITYNTCDGLTKLPDVNFKPDCHDVTEVVKTKVKVITRASGSGSIALADAQGTADSPQRLWVKATTKPRQKADVIWTVDCEDSDYNGNSASGTYTSRSAKRHKLRMTIPKPASCTFGALATIRRGRVEVQLLAEVPRR